MTPSFELPSEKATRALAERLAPLLAGGDLLILSGALGAGKTFFARGLCAALGVDPEQVTSPTFALVHEFEGALPIAHADLYRLRSAAELRELGLDALRDEGCLLVVEWGEPYASELGGDALLASFTLEPRRVAFSASGARSEALRSALDEIAQKLDGGAGAR